ncbi:energy transducer TonB [Polynucleobacter sp. AM-26B4]|uniref:energy transducer TonB family protein n=1 Tax=Polynucleobacter sp. AM-26B4 TaxID=2689103 RepID=UPI001C0D6A26|nr:energy transducer TonB [Polynucleobacter sp. AM-26B4]MBU3585939.1 energy transducer TonB [Polynucleobacter sp. AM-26B4]
MGLLISLAFHLILIVVGLSYQENNPIKSKPLNEVVQVKLEPEQKKEERKEKKPEEEQTLVLNTQRVIPEEKKLAYMDAPPAPSAEEWQKASTYTLKNSKRYRHNWGQQVRSMMGRSVEGPDQGMVRFHIEIAANGKLSKLETLWSTSPVAEKLARQAIENMPPLPPIPTGKPLIFQKTISFQPVDDGWPPIYKYDCLPDPPTFKNPFAWDGKSAPVAVQQKVADGSKQEMPTDCPASEDDTIEAEAADMKRQFEIWGSSRLNPKK